MHDMSTSSPSSIELRVEDGWLSAQDAHELMALAGPRFHAPLVVETEGGQEHPLRTGDVAWLPHDTDPAVRTVVERIATRLGLPVSHAESMQVVRYREGQGYHAHHDAFDPLAEAGRRCMRRGGQRVATAIVYLQQPDAGGGTLFPVVGEEVAPVAGRLVSFRPAKGAELRRNPAALHEARPVEAGEKWIANLWFHERRVDVVEELPPLPPAEQLRLAARSFPDRGLAHLRGVVSPDLLASLALYVEALMERGVLGRGDAQHGARRVRYDDPLLALVEHLFQPIVVELAGEPVRASHTYLVVYGGGEGLERHRDRPVCAFTVDLPILHKGAEDGVWPLDVDGVELPLRVGDVAVFRGHELPHGCPPLPEGRTVANLLLHFVPEAYEGPLG